MVKGQIEWPQGHRTVLCGFCVHSLSKQLKLGNFVPHPTLNPGGGTYLATNRHQLYNTGIAMTNSQR